MTSPKWRQPKRERARLAPSSWQLRRATKIVRNQVPREHNGGRPGSKRKRRESKKNKKRTEDNLIPFLPHLRDNRLARIDHSSKPDLDIFELAERLQNVLARDTHGAQSVEDGPRRQNSKRRDGGDESVPCPDMRDAGGSVVAIELTYRIHQLRRTRAGSGKVEVQPRQAWGDERKAHMERVEITV